MKRDKTDRRIGRYAARLGRQCDVTVLWEPPKEDWPNWLAAGCGDLSREEYLARLATVERELAAAGVTSVRLRATTTEVLDELKSLGLTNDPSGRSAAVASLWQRTNKP